MIKRADLGFRKGFVAILGAMAFFVWAGEIPLTQAQPPAGHSALLNADARGSTNMRDDCPTPSSSADQRDSSAGPLGNPCIASDVKIPPGIIIGAHPVIGRGTILGNRIAIGDNVIVGSWVVIEDGATLGRGVIVGDGSKIENDARIGDHVILGSNVVIGSGAVIDDRAIVGRGALVGEDASIGAGSDVAEDAYVPRGSHIAAHSVVATMHPELAGFQQPEHHRRRESS